MRLDIVLTVTAVLIGLAGLVRAAEDWTTRAEYRPKGLLSREILMLQGASGMPRLLSRFMASYLVTCTCVVGRLAAAIALLVAAAIAPALVGPVLLVDLALLVFFLLQCGYGADGADQMLIVLCAGAFLASTTNPISRAAGLWLITAQLVLSFLVAGAAKLLGPEWRGGRALPGILTTHRYGSPWVAGMLTRAPVLSRLMCWGVIGLELTFPVVLLGIPALTVAYLAAGLSFHVGVAMAMGLNNFLYTFGAAYPVAAFCLIR